MKKKKRPKKITYFTFFLAVLTSSVELLIVAPNLFASDTIINNILGIMSLTVWSVMLFILCMILMSE